MKFFNRLIVIFCVALAISVLGFYLASTVSVGFFVLGLTGVFVALVCAALILALLIEAKKKPSGRDETVTSHFEHCEITSVEELENCLTKAGYNKVDALDMFEKTVYRKKIGDNVHDVIFLFTLNEAEDLNETLYVAMEDAKDTAVCEHFTQQVIYGAEKVSMYDAVKIIDKSQIVRGDVEYHLVIEFSTGIVYYRRIFSAEKNDVMQELGKEMEMLYGLTHIWKSC